MSSTHNDLPPGIQDQDIIAILSTSRNSAQPSVLHLKTETPTLLQTPLSASTSTKTDIQEKYTLKTIPPHLRISPEDIHVLISTKSGTEKAESCFESVLKPLLHAVGIADGGYQVLRTESEDSVREFAAGLLKEKAGKGVQQTVILLSGDGGVVDIVNGLMGGAEDQSSTFVRPTLIILPLGTGNALFHSLHRPVVHATSTNPAPATVPSDLTLALRNLVIGTTYPLPIFRATFSPSSRLLTNEARTASSIPSNSLYGTIVASYGFHATLVADSDTAVYRRHGAARFGMVGQELLAPASGSDPHAYEARVNLSTAASNKTLEREAHGYILLTLVSNLEKTFTISPASRPLDGKMRVIHFGPERATEVMRIMGEAYAGGKHVEKGVEGKVGYEEVTGMRIEMLGKDDDGDEGMEGRWRRVCVDGLIVRIERGGWVEVAAVAEDKWPLQVALDPSVIVG